MLAMLAVGILPLLIVGAGVDVWIERVVTTTTSAAGVATLVVTLLGLDTVLPVPSSVLATVSGARLGFAGAAVVITIGLCLGNALGYVLGRVFGSPVVERLVGPSQLARAQALATTRPGAVALAVTRPVPILSEAVILLAGAARTSVARTAVVCALANAGIALALPLLLAGSIGLPVAALLLTPVLLRRRRAVA